MCSRLSKLSKYWSVKSTVLEKSRRNYSPSYSIFSKEPSIVTTLRHNVQSVSAYGAAKKKIEIFSAASSNTIVYTNQVLIGYRDNWYILYGRKKRCLKMCSAPHQK